jgi:hypothetical protein
MAFSSTNCSSVSSMAAPAMLSSRWLTFEVPGIGSMTGERLSSQARASCDGVAPQPGKGQLRRCRAALGGQLCQRAAGACQCTGGQREPPDERDAIAGRVVEQGLGGAVGEVEHVLHGDDRGDFLRGPQLLHGDLGQADVADLPLVPQALQLAHLVGERDGRVDAVELEQVDALQA